MYMNLGVSIANLLRRYPAVGVPGIGVFRKTHRPASYDTDIAAFRPPVDRIELVDNDTDVFQLTTYLEVQQQLDGPAAEAMLNDAVKATMDTISRNGEAALDGLGYLLADGASFLFKPFEIDGFAAEPIAATPPAAGVADEPAALADEVIDAPAEPELATTVEDTGRRGYTPWILGGAVAAVLIAVVVVWQYQPEWFGDRAAGPAMEVNESKPLVVETDRDSMVADTGLVIATADSAPVDSVPATPPASVPPAKPSVTYEIIVGSFTSMRQADKFVAEMKAKGYDLQAIDSRMPGNRKKISWGSYATEEEAYKELARVQKTFEPGAWIAKIVH